MKSKAARFNNFRSAFFFFFAKTLAETRQRFRAAMGGSPPWLAVPETCWTVVRTVSVRGPTRSMQLHSHSEDFPKASRASSICLVKIRVTLLHNLFKVRLRVHSHQQTLLQTMRKPTRDRHTSCSNGVSPRSFLCCSLLPHLARGKIRLCYRRSSLRWNEREPQQRKEIRSRAFEPDASFPGSYAEPAIRKLTKT